MILGNVNVEVDFDIKTGRALRPNPLYITMNLYDEFPKPGDEAYDIGIGKYLREMEGEEVVIKRKKDIPLNELPNYEEINKANKIKKLEEIIEKRKRNPITFVANSLVDWFSSRFCAVKQIGYSREL